MRWTDGAKKIVKEEVDSYGISLVGDILNTFNHIITQVCISCVHTLYID